MRARHKDTRQGVQDDSIIVFLKKNPSLILVTKDKGLGKKAKEHKLQVRARKSIGVELVHVDNPRELTSFKGKIHQLCGNSNPLQQIKEVEPSELEKIPSEVLERTIETTKKRVKELQIVTDRYLRARISLENELRM